MFSMHAPRNTRAVIGAPSGGSAGLSAPRARGGITAARPTPTPLVRPEPIKKAEPTIAEKKKANENAKVSSEEDYDDDWNEGG